MSFDLSPRAAHEVAKVEVVLGEEAAVEMAALQVGTSEAGSDRSSDRSRTSTPVPRARPERKMNSSSSTIGPASINSREAEPSSAPSLAQESSTGLSSQPKGVEDGAGGNGPALFAANELQASPQGLTPTEATADQRKKGRSSELSSNDVSGVATPEEPIGQLLIVEDDIERPSVQLATP